MALKRRIRDSSFIASSPSGILKKPAIRPALLKIPMKPTIAVANWMKCAALRKLVFEPFFDCTINVPMAAFEEISNKTIAIDKVAATPKSDLVRILARIILRKNEAACDTDVLPNTNVIEENIFLDLLTNIMFT